MPQPLESQLAYLGFRRFSPGPILRPYISEYWHFRREAPLVGCREEYMHPAGAFGIVFNFGDRLRLDGEPVGEPVFLHGANSVSRKFCFQGHVEQMGVRFRVGGAYPFVGVPLMELRNATGLLDAVDRRGLLRLHARLHEADSLWTRIELLEAWLIGRLMRGKERHAVIPRSLTLIGETPGEREGHLPIPALARELAISQRQLERLYQSQVGVSPRQYVQLIRVGRARMALKEMNARSTTDLAVELGFYDQSHFIREFSAVIGMTPYAYAKGHRKQSERA